MTPVLTVRLAEGAPSAEAEAAAERAGGPLIPMHPGEEDPRLAGWFTADVPDEVAAGRLQDELLALSAVEAAFIAPDAEPA